MTVPPTVTERFVVEVDVTEVSSPLLCVPSSKSASSPEPLPSTVFSFASTSAAVYVDLRR